MPLAATAASRSSTSVGAKGAAFALPLAHRPPDPKICSCVVLSPRSGLFSSMLLHRVTSLGRALLAAGVLALTALGTAAPLVHGADASVPREQATIESQNHLPTDHLKTGEQVELVSAEPRSSVPAPVANSCTAERERSRDCRQSDASRWCDVVQCRRIGGAMMLGFATPPPTRR